MAGHAGIEVREIEGKGRGLFATKSLQSGDIILKETPLVSSQFSWNKLYGYEACHHCLKSLENAEEMAKRLTSNSSTLLPWKDCCETINISSDFVKCPDCKDRFCSVNCLETAKRLYHQVLCHHDASNTKQDHPLTVLDELWRSHHFPPETTSINLICRMIAMVIQAGDKQHIFNKLSDFCNLPINGQKGFAHKILGEHFQNRLEQLRLMLINTIFDDVVTPWLTEDGFKCLFAMIGMNGQGIATSSLSQYVHNVDARKMSADERLKTDSFIDKLYEDMEEVSGNFLNCEGSGLFHLQSRINHSCQPNAEVTFPYNNSTLVLVALADVQPQEEICICYLDECQRTRSRHSRQKILRNNYLFSCECSLCQDQIKDEDLTSEDDNNDDDDDEME